MENSASTVVHNLYWILTHSLSATCWLSLRFLRSIPYTVHSQSPLPPARFHNPRNALAERNVDEAEADPGMSKEDMRERGRLLIAADFGIVETTQVPNSLRRAQS